MLTLAGMSSQSDKKTFNSEGERLPIVTFGTASPNDKKNLPDTVALTGRDELQKIGGSTRYAIGAGTNVNKSSLTDEN